MLLVEDDLVSASALSTILRRRGFEVCHVVTIAGAMDHLADKPDFVLLDLMLPDGNGSEVLKAICDAGLACRVIVVTAVSDPELLRLVKDLKPEALIQKPIDLPKLLAMMRPFH